MKKVLAFVLMMAMCLSLVACSGGNGSSSSKPSSSSSSSSSKGSSSSYSSGSSSSHTCYVCEKKSSSCEKIGSYWYCSSCAELMHAVGY